MTDKELKEWEEENREAEVIIKKIVIILAIGAAISLIAFAIGLL
jgi:hypothetical protein